MRSLPSFPQFRGDVKLLLAAVGLLAVSFFGIQMLLKILYVLRLGYGPEYLGLFNAAGAVGYMAMSLPSGALGARFGLTRTMFAGALVAALGMGLLPFTEMLPDWAQYSWPILTQVVLSGGYAMFSINLAPALMVVTSAENRNSAYALSSTLRSLGTLVGTLSGGLLPGFFGRLLGQELSDPGPYRWALWLSAVLALMALAPLARLRRAEQATQDEHEPIAGAFPVWPVALLVIYVSLSQAASATCQSFCSAFMDTELQLSPAVIGVITSGGQFVAVFAPLTGPRLARRRGNGWTLMIVSLSSALSLLPLILLPTWFGVGLGRLGTLVLSAMWMPALQVYQMEMVERHWRGLAYGAVSMAMGLSFGTISLAGGYVVASWGYSALFVMGLCLSTLGAALMWGMLRRPAMLVATERTVR